MLQISPWLLYLEYDLEDITEACAIVFYGVFMNNLKY